MKGLRFNLAAVVTIYLLMGVAGAALAADEGGKTDEGMKININTASVQELTKLKGVGEKLAAGIVAYREANGPFKTVQDLELVKGIGPKILADNADMLTVGPTAPAPTPTPAPAPPAPAPAAPKP